MNLITYDGRQITLITADTQTDWDWVDQVPSDEALESPHEGNVQSQ